MESHSTLKAEIALHSSAPTSAAPYTAGTAAIGVKPKKACQMLDCGTTRLYELLAANELVSYKDGRSRKILVSSITAYVKRKLDIAA